MKKMTAGRTSFLFHAGLRRVAVCLLLASASADGLAASAVILGVKGDVSVISGGKKTPAATGLRIEAGDTVKSGTGTASLLMSDGRMRSVTPGQTFTLPPEKAPAAAEPLAGRLMASLKETVQAGTDPLVTAAVRGTAEMAPVYPFNACVAREDVRFEWKGPDKKIQVEIVIQSPDPVYKFAFRTNAVANKADFPADAPALQPGAKYYWRVTDLTDPDNEPPATTPCWFTILSAADKEKLAADLQAVDLMKETDENARRLLKANLYASLGLYHPAVDLLEKCRQAFPDDAGILTMLKGIFARMNHVEALKNLK